MPALRCWIGPARLAPGGLLLIADVFREPGEARAAYLQRYIHRIRTRWSSLAPHLQDHVIDHLSGSDFPAERDGFVAMAAEAGWQAHWIWCGSHQAEALVALRRP